MTTLSMDETASIKSASPAGTTASNGTKRKRDNMPKFYAVRVGYRPGVYHTWADCLEQVKGFKKATCEIRASEPTHHSFANKSMLVKSFSTLTDAERFVAGENPAQSASNGSSPPTKFYAVKNGRVPGIYLDWPSAQEQITGWQKPRHRCFMTRSEAQRFLDEDEGKAGEGSPTIEAENGLSAMYNVSEAPPELDIQPPAQKKAKKNFNGTKLAAPEYNEVDYEPGTGPMPPDAEDGFDPNIMLDPYTGNLVYKTPEQRQAIKPRPSGVSQTEPIRIHTDGSSLGNGKAGAFAGVGVYFGPGDKRFVLPISHPRTKSHVLATLTLLLPPQ